MRICMVWFDMQESGGLEEYAAALATAHRQHGHDVSVLSTAWVPQENQYLRRLRHDGVTFVQPPRWLSNPASDGPTKQRILAASLFLLEPLTWLLAGALFLLRTVRSASTPVEKRSWRAALTSARGWLGGQLMDRFIGPDRREPFTRLMLDWWRWRWRPDVLHLQGYTQNLLFVIDWARARSVPVVYEEHQTPDPRFDWWKGFGRTVNKADVVVAVSDTSGRALRDVCGITRPIVVRSPLLADPMAPGGRTRTARRPDAPARITTVARLSVAKGIPFLLDAIVKVRVSHPTAIFKVYGEGPLLGELVARARQLGLDGEEIFAGTFTHPELASILAETDVFVLSSILEGQPLAVVEAMACGCPIVTTSVGGIPELIRDGINGLLCEPADADCLARKVCVLLEDPDLRHRLGEAARKSYESGPYQPAAVSNQLLAIYRDALAQVSPSPVR